MTWSYSGNPAFSGKDAVRWWIGDIDEDRPLAQDAELEYELVVSGGNVLQAAKAAIIKLMNHFATLGKVEMGGGRSSGLWMYDASQIVKALQTALDIINQQLTPQDWYAGGISIADKLRVSGNGDRVVPRFARGMMGNPRLGGSGGSGGSGGNGWGGWGW